MQDYYKGFWLIISPLAFEGTPEDSQQRGFRLRNGGNGLRVTVAEGGWVGGGDVGLGTQFHVLEH